MDREKLGQAISTALSTFLTVYVALRIGKAIGRREVIEEVSAFADRELDRLIKHGREQATSVTRQDKRPSEGVTLQPGESVTIPLGGIGFADDEPSRWWDRPLNGPRDWAIVAAGGTALGIIVGTIASALL